MTLQKNPAYDKVMDPINKESVQEPLTTELDEALPIDFSFSSKKPRKHHRLMLFASILKRRYLIIIFFLGIFLCILGEVLLAKLLYLNQTKNKAAFTIANIKSVKILPPKKGIYFSAYPDLGDAEDDVTVRKIDDFATLAQKKPFWVYFSNNWYNGIAFPKEAVTTIDKNGSVPFIRLMPRSMLYETTSEPILTMKRIAKGDFDSFLKQWAKDAKSYAKPLMVEFGPEVNGDWEPWNGTYTGGAKNGPQQFIAAYRHIIQLFRTQGVENITWVYHITIPSSPDTSWNSYAAYYPGNDYIDWIGLSVYGALSTDDTWQSFTDKLDKAYPQLLKAFPQKPFAVVETGVVENPDKGNKAIWLKRTFTALQNNRYPNIKAISLWHAQWQEANGNEANSRIDSSPEVLDTVRQAVASPFFIGGVGKITTPSSFIQPSALLQIQTPQQQTSVPTGTPTVSAKTESLIGKPWQWQLTGTIDTTIPANMYDVDYENTDASTVAALHAKGAKVICYINAGMWEPRRSDSANFPSDAIGSTVDGSDNKWLDISNADAIASIMEKRLDTCKQKGFDGVDPDSIDGYARNTGFSFTADDQIAYNRWLAGQAHARGLQIGLHNDNDQVNDLLGYFDFAILDACINQGTCSDFNQFILFGKPVFDAEYTDNGTTTDVCDKAKSMQFSVIIKSSQLDSSRQSCQ